MSQACYGYPRRNLNLVCLFRLSLPLAVFKCLFYLFPPPTRGSPYLQHRVATLVLVLQHGRRHQNHPTRNPFWKSTLVVFCFGPSWLLLSTFLFLNLYPNARTWAVSSSRPCRTCGGDSRRETSYSASCGRIKIQNKQVDNSSQPGPKQKTTRVDFQNRFLVGWF